MGTEFHKKVKQVQDDAGIVNAVIYSDHSLAEALAD